MVNAVHRYDSPRSKRFLKRAHAKLIRRLARTMLEDTPIWARKGWWY